MKHSALKKIVLIGASTGGPGQIQKIVSSLPILQNTTDIIAQHMVEGFINSFANRLNKATQNLTSVVTHNQILLHANIYLCDGQTQLKQDSYSLSFIHKATEDNSYNPDINNLFLSFVDLCKDVEILSVILTGIGDDGVSACKELSLNGAKCLTESAESAIVDGMPSRARLLVPNIEVTDLQTIIKKINEFCN